MRNIQNRVLTVWLFVLGVFFASCGNAPTENKTTTKDTVAKPKWIDPQRGKIWGKVNVVQIPLTAMENHILGPVKSVRYAEYKISEKDGKKELDDSGYNVYDKFGHLVDQNEYKANGKPKWNCIYKYDDQNKATLWDFKVYDDDYITKTTFKYDSKGNKIEENEVDSNKKYSRRIVYKYDDKGNETEDDTYRGDGKLSMIMMFKYDSRGFQVEYDNRSPDGKLVTKITCEYDNNGNKTGGASYHSDTDCDGKWVERNDDKGRTIERTTYRPVGKVFSLTRYKYDDLGNITEDLTYKPDGSIDTSGWNRYTEFEYDSKGNAIKETWYRLKDGKKVMTDVAERKFEYY